MAAMPKARDKKANESRSSVIKQDYVYWHPVDPVNPVKRNPVE